MDLGHEDLLFFFKPTIPMENLVFGRKRRVGKINS